MSIIIFILVTAPVSHARYWKENFGVTRQTKRNCQGTGCGANTGHDCDPLDAEISPNPVRGKPNEEVIVRFDCTQICNGQTAHTIHGYVKSEAGGFQETLPDSYTASKRVTKTSV